MLRCCRRLHNERTRLAANHFIFRPWNLDGLSDLSRVDPSKSLILDGKKSHEGFDDDGMEKISRM